MKNRITHGRQYTVVPGNARTKTANKQITSEKTPSDHRGYRNFDKVLFHIYVNFNNKQILVPVFTFHTSCSVQQDLGLVCSHSIPGTPIAQRGALFPTYEDL